MFAAEISSAGSQTLTAGESALVEKMLAQWAKHLSGNKRRLDVYNQKNLFNDFRISTPPQLRNLDAVLGWGAKAVDCLSDRINFEGFVLPGVDDNPLGLTDIVQENDFQVEFSQAVTSMLIHSCVFVTVSMLDDGLPRWYARSAQQATGLWDAEKRGLKAGLTVSLDDNGTPERFFVYFPDRTVELTRKGGRFVASVWANHMGRIPMEVFRFQPNLKRPFGKSRITRAVEYYIQGGVRSLVRSEIGAEFFAAPQRYGLGINDRAFDNDRWTAVMGRIWALTRDEEGELPQIGQFPQHSMQPHAEHLRMWAAQMSGETSIPMNELGFFTDNPTSEQALQSQRDPLRLIADKTIRGFQAGLRRLAVTSVMLRDGLTEAPAEALRLSAKFEPTFRVADSAAADAALKQAQVVPWITESPVFLEKLNYSPQEVQRLLEDKRRAEGVKALNELLAAPDDAADDDSPVEDTAV